jgi:shikimate dehydrogenase
MAGAVNAVRRNGDGTIEGALFDGVGFVRGLDHFGLPVAGRQVLVVGTGGGGQAVASALAQRGPARLALYNRTAARTIDLAQRVRLSTGAPVEAVASADPAGFDLIVNCTSQGLKPGDALPVDVARIDAGAAVVDIIMTRQPTPLLQACAARGITAHPGFEMLVRQVPEYLRFFGLPELAQALQNDLSEVRGLLASR